MITAANYASIWRQPHLRPSLEAHCLACQHLPVDDLPTHLATTHPIDHVLIQSMYDQVQCPDLGCCRWCIEAQDLPERCPVALNLAHFIRAIQHDGLHGGHRLDGAGAGCGGGLAGSTATEEGQTGGGRRGTARRAPEGKGQGQGKRQKQATGWPPAPTPATGGPPTDHGPAHFPDVEARITIAGAGQHRPISALFAGRTRVPDAKHPPTDPAMERAANQGHQHATTTRGAGTDGDTGDSRPLHEAPSHGPTGSLVAEGHPPTHHHSRGHVAIPAMGSDSEEASSVAQQDPYQGGEDSESTGGPSGAHEEPRSPAEVQKSPTTTDIQEDSDTLPHSGQHARQPPVRHTVVAESQFSLDAGGGPTSTAHGPPDTVGEPAPQRTWARWPCYLDQGLATLMGWKLINQQNACWLNATMVSFLWAQLQCRDLHWQDLGVGTALFQSLCSRASNSLDLLRDQATQALLHGWQCEGQQELLSFTSHFLGWCQPRLVDNTWERKLDEEAQIKCHDQGGKLGPIILTPAAQDKKILPLQDCVDEWHTQYGMVTALHHVQTCVVLYIEKSQFSPLGVAAKAEWRLQLPPNGVIWLPRFREAGDLAIDHVACQVSSMIVHSGSLSCLLPGTQWVGLLSGQLGSTARSCPPSGPGPGHPAGLACRCPQVLDLPSSCHALGAHEG